MKRMTILAGGAIAVAAVAGAAAAVASLSPAPDGTHALAPPTAVAGTAAGAASPLMEAANAARGEAVFRTCSACHTVGRGGADVDGPNLFGVVGARVAERRPRYGYTQALRDTGGAWTEARLAAWLTDPAAFAPGTAMHFPGLPDAQERADVIAYLKLQSPARR